jgi:hypothetical protein
MLSVRLVTLYSRSRFVPATLAVIAAATLSTLALDVSDARLISVLVGFGVAAASVGLGGADVQLERTGAIPWPSWRFVHLVIAVVVIAGSVAAADLGPFGIVFRDTCGLLGLAALGAAVLGSQLAWVPPFVWTVIAAVFPLADEEVLMWMIQPADSSTAAITATAVGIVGTAAYVARGPRG